MAITASALRANVYRILDEVVATGEPVEIVRGGHTLKIIVDEPNRTSRLERVRTSPESLKVDPEDIIHIDWSGEWNPSSI